MNTVTVSDAMLRQAAEEGMDAFVQVIYNAIMDSIGGQLNAENMAQLNADQISLIAYIDMRNEVMDGGFVQLIYNGLGGFIFLNPFGKAMRQWGIDDLASMIRKVGNMYRKDRDELERERSDEEFMALFEQYPAYDDFDDSFVENEERWTAQVACYVDEHLDNFVSVTAE